MVASRQRTGNRLLDGRRVLIALLALLAVCWWAMSLRLFPDWHPPVAPHVASDAALLAEIHQGDLGLRISFWIASWGWDSGPPVEFAYDFIMFWHLALSLLAYLGILMWADQRTCLREGAGAQTLNISRSTIRWLIFWYPALSMAIMWIFPWEMEISGAQKVFALTVEPALLASLAYLAWVSPGRRAIPRLLRAAGLLAAVLCLAAPIHGRGQEIIAIMLLALVMTVWALVNRFRLHAAAGRDAVGGSLKTHQI